MVNSNLRKEMLSIIEEGKVGVILLKGISMEPTFSDGTVLYVQRQEDYVVGDIVVFTYPKEGYLVHRIVDIQNGAILCKGDNAKRVEVIMKRQILGKVVGSRPHQEQQIPDMDKLYRKIHTSMQYLLAKELINDLNTSGIAYAIVKGCPLAYYKTGKTGTRLSCDIDLLIARQDITKLEGILEQNEFKSSYIPDRKERIMLVTGSHQLPTYSKMKGGLRSEIDVNFDLFWGEYTGKRIDIKEFLNDTVEMEIYGCKIKTLPPLKAMVQLILHHYKELNSLYHLTGHVAVKKRLFEDVYLLCKRFPQEISIDNLYEVCSRYEIIPYAYYMFYYTKKVYAAPLLDAYLKALRTDEGENLLEFYGLAEQERRPWRIPFEERLDRDVSSLIYSEMSENDREKLERNRRVFG